MKHETPSISFVTGREETGDLAFLHLTDKTRTTKRREYPYGPMYGVTLITHDPI